MILIRKRRERLLARIPKSEAIRLKNMRNILKVVRKEGPVSLPDLQRIAGLSQPTVSTAINALVGAGLVTQAGYGDSRGGRAPRLVRLNASAGYVIGVDLGGTNIKSAVVNMEGTVLRAITEPTRTDEYVDIFEAVCNAIDRGVRTSGVSWNKVQAIGIGVPGITDPDVGSVSFAPALKWSGLPIRQMLSDRFGVPVCVENDVNAAALAEIMFGVGLQVRDFVFIAIGTGIGAGIVLNGSLRRGCKFAAGEIGNMCIDKDWQAGTMNDMGCLERMAAAGAFHEKATEILGVGASVEDLFSDIRRGNSRAEEAVREIARLIAMAVVNIWVVVDPELVVLGGGISQAGDLLLEPIKNECLRLCPIVPRVAISALGGDAGLYGAVAIALDTAEMSILKTI